MKKIVLKIKNATRTYFLVAAYKPVSIALAVVIALFILLLSIFMFQLFINSEALKTNLAVIVFYYLATLFFFLWILHVVVAKLWITVFPEKKNRIILLLDEKETKVYSSPIWGKVPNIVLDFPDNWDLNDNYLERAINLKIMVPIIDQSLAYLTFKSIFYFNGHFQASDLMEIIKYQRVNGQHTKEFCFQKCLQVIMAQRFSDYKVAIKDWLIRWQKKEMSTKELEKKLLYLNLIPQGLFANVGKIDLRLLPPELINKTLHREK